MKAAFFLVQQDPIDEEALAGSILSNDGNDAKLSVLGEVGEKFFGFLGESETNAFLVGDEGNGEGRMTF